MRLTSKKNIITELNYLLIRYYQRSPEVIIYDTSSEEEGFTPFKYVLYPIKQLPTKILIVCKNRNKHRFFKIEDKFYQERGHKKIEYKSFKKMLAHLKQFINKTN